MNKKLYKGSDIILKSLEKEKVEYIFGYPGGSVLCLYDSIYKNKKIKHILTRHEQGAGHAADGYYRSTQKIAVVFATSGPGATNLVTSIATAQMDSIPIIFITGQVSKKYLGKQSFQEANIIEIVKSITKYASIIYDARNIAKEIKRAFKIAKSGRKGPVLLDIPKDVMSDKSIFCYPKENNASIGYRNKKNKYKEIVNLLINAKKPVILLGGGAVNAKNEIRKLVKRLKIPVVYSLMGKGIFDDNNLLNIGMIGMHGHAASNYAVYYCDVLLAIGTRFNDRTTGKKESFTKNAKIIHIDIDSNEFNKNINANIFLHEDSSVAISKIILIIKEKYFEIDKKNLWLNQINKWEYSNKLKYKKSGLIKPQEVLLAINKITKGNAIMVTEVGQHQMWAAQYYKVKDKKNFITSGGLGTMGFGLPASIGVQLGNPRSMIILFSGDGSIQMNSQELITISANKLPIKIIIINNQSLGMVKQWQKIFYKKHYSQTIFLNKDEPDYILLAKAYKILAIQIKKRKDLIKNLEIALNDKKNPYLIEVKVDPESDVYPMVPSGLSNKEMMLK